MIRWSAHHLLTTTPPPSKFALAVAKPAAAVLSGKIGQVRALSAKPKRSDAPPASPPRGKDEKSTLRPVATFSPPGRSFAQEVWRSGHSQHPLFRRFFGFDDFFGNDPWAPFGSSLFHRDVFDDSAMPVLKRFPANQSTLVRSSPGYEIKEGEKTYEIAIDVPKGVTASDMNIELEQDGKVLHISGERQTKEEKGFVHTRFDKHFTIGENIDIEKLSANLDDGVLVVKAPKIAWEETEEPVRKIAITENPHQVSDEDIMHKSFSDAFDESDWAEQGKEAQKTDKAA